VKADIPLAPKTLQFDYEEYVEGFAHFDKCKASAELPSSNIFSALLNTMHAHGNHDSLLYWLEFKNNEEFPDIFAETQSLLLGEQSHRSPRTFCSLMTQEAWAGPLDHMRLGLAYREEPEEARPEARER